MPKSLGHIVYLFKDRSSSDAKRADGHTMQMAQRAPKLPAPPPEDPIHFAWTAPPDEMFRPVVCGRIKDARDKAGYTQRSMATALGIEDASKYAKYESRSLMPHEYLTRFAELTRTRLEDLLRDPR